MDPGVLALLIPIVAIISVASVKIARLFATSRAPARDPEVLDRIASLEEEVGMLRRELEEAHERLNFTERLLAQPRTDRVGPSS
jgi:hypothetical protein